MTLFLLLLFGMPPPSLPDFEPLVERNPVELARGRARLHTLVSPKDIDAGIVVSFTSNGNGKHNTSGKILGAVFSRFWANQAANPTHWSEKGCSFGIGGDARFAVEDGIAYSGLTEICSSINGGFPARSSHKGRMGRYAGHLMSFLVLIRNFWRL